MGFLGVFALFYVVPKFSTDRGKLVAVGTILSIVAIAQGGEMLADYEQQRAEAAAAQKRAREEAERQGALRRQFNAMTPLEHLEESTKLLQPNATPDAILQANKHIAAIPAVAAEAERAQAVKAKFAAEQQRRAMELANHQKIQAAQAAKAMEATQEGARIAFAKTV
jgi:hypothetical protein